MLNHSKTLTYASIKLQHPNNALSLIRNVQHPSASSSKTSRNNDIKPAQWFASLSWLADTRIHHGTNKYSERCSLRSLCAPIHSPNRALMLMNVCGKCGELLARTKRLSIWKDSLDARSMFHSGIRTGTGSISGGFQADRTFSEAVKGKKRREPARSGDSGSGEECRDGGVNWLIRRWRRGSLLMEFGGQPTDCWMKR